MANIQLKDIHFLFTKELNKYKVRLQRFVKSKAIPLHVTEALERRGRIANAHS
jgi:hypothetical protein